MRDDTHAWSRGRGGSRNGAGRSLEHRRRDRDRGRARRRRGRRRSVGGRAGRGQYKALGGFLGVGARATSKHPVFRVTAGAALGVAVHQLLGLTTLPCDDRQGNSSCFGSSTNPSTNPSSPGYAAAAMSGDVGILLGNGSPGAKLWIGVDWHVDFPPDVTVGPINDTRIPAQLLPNQGATILHGPQFFIGPVIGIGFGH